MPSSPMNLRDFHALMHEAQQAYLEAVEYQRRAYALEEEAKRLWRERGKEAGLDTLVSGVTLH